MIRITSLDEFRAKVAHKEEIREAEIAPGLISFCYMISAENTFDDAWARECRGIVFSKETGRVVGRPLHKFFNVNERPETHVGKLPAMATRVMDKRDGSMIHTVNTIKKGDSYASYKLKSKKSFSSDVAVAATKWIEQAHMGYDALCQRVQLMDCTAIFEYTAPDARIVLPYYQPKLTLLHIRDNEYGEYWSSDDLKKIAHAFNVECVEETHKTDEEIFAFNVAQLVEDAKTRENIEGWIVQFNDDEMVKIKTDWYLKRHRAMTFLRERDIAQLVLDEGLDDVKSMLVGDGVDITEILAIETRVAHELSALAKMVHEVVTADKHLDRKTFAIKHTGHQYFGLIMSAYIGKEPNFKEYFERNLLKDRYSLRQLNLLNSVAEAE
jgi:RNA ligase